MKDQTRDEYMTIISGLTERKDYAEQKMLEAEALAGKQVNRADDLQDDLDREKEDVRILEAKVKEADEIIAKKFADWTASAGESRLIRVAISRALAGESAESLAHDYGLDRDTFDDMTALVAKVKGLEEIRANLIAHNNKLEQERDTLKGELAEASEKIMDLVAHKLGLENDAPLELRNKLRVQDHKLQRAWKEIDTLKAALVEKETRIETLEDQLSVLGYTS